MDQARKAGAPAVIWTTGWLLLLLLPSLLLQEGGSAIGRAWRGSSGGSGEEGPLTFYRDSCGKDLRILSRRAVGKIICPGQRRLWEGFLPWGAVVKLLPS